MSAEKRLIDTFFCIDDQGNRHEVEEYVEIKDAGHMQDADSALYGMREYRTKDGLRLSSLGSGRFYSQTLLTEMRRT